MEKKYDKQHRVISCERWIKRGCAGCGIDSKTCKVVETYIMCKALQNLK